MKIFSKHHLPLYIILGTSLLIHFLFRSPYLEDWDSAQFAMSLHHYSLLEQLPHAPGYPLYVLLGKFFYFFFRDDTQALTTLSALLGSLAIIPFFLLTKKMFDQKTAILASILFFLTPVRWTLSEVALTNIPGLFFLLVLAYFIYTQSQKPQILILLSGLGGFILGIRFTEFTIIVCLLILANVKIFNPRVILFSALAFLGGMALWVIPLILLSGADKFLQSYSWIAGYILTHDTQLKASSSLKSVLRSRISALWYLLQVGYTIFFILTSILAFGQIFLKKSLLKEWKYQFLTVWFISYLIPLMFIYNLEVPRYTLPLLPPLTIFTAAMLTSWIKKQPLLAAVSFSLIIILALQSWSQITRFNSQIPPTIQPIYYVNKNFDPQSTVLLTSFTYRQFQYYAPEFNNYYGDKINQPQTFNSQIIIIDYLGLKNKIANLSAYEIVGQQIFVGDKDIFTRISEVTLYILKKK